MHVNTCRQLRWVAGGKQVPAVGCEHEASLTGAGLLQQLVHLDANLLVWRRDLKPHACRLAPRGTITSRWHPHEQSLRW